jgi:hypothetical protein
MAQPLYAQHATVTQDGQGNPFLVYTGQNGSTLYEINSLGEVSVVAGVTSAGIGQPVIVASYSATLGFALFLTSGSAAITLLAATAPAGTYRLTAYAVISTTFSGNSVATVPITIGWTDSVHAQTNATILAGGTLTANFEQQGVLTINSAGTAAITITPSATTGNPTAGAMNVYITIERLI